MANILFFAPSDHGFRILRENRVHQEECLLSFGDVYSFSSFEAFRKAGWLPAQQLIVSNEDVDDASEGAHIEKIRTDPIFKDRFNKVPAITFSSCTNWPYNLRTREKTSHVWIRYNLGLPWTLRGLKGYVPFDTGVTQLVKDRLPRPTRPGKLMSGDQFRLS